LSRYSRQLSVKDGIVSSERHVQALLRRCARLLVGGDTAGLAAFGLRRFGEVRAWRTLPGGISAAHLTRRTGCPGRLRELVQCRTLNTPLPEAEEGGTFFEEGGCSRFNQVQLQVQLSNVD
jgi:hypothetical protein